MPIHEIIPFRVIPKPGPAALSCRAIALAKAEVTPRRDEGGSSGPGFFVDMDLAMVILSGGFSFS